MIGKSGKFAQQNIIRQLGTIKQQFNLIDIKNDHLVYLKDPKGKLPFMREIITDKGQKGIVLKL